MPVEVKQLTINSVFQRAESDGEASPEETLAEKTVAEQKKRQSESSCLDPAELKADVLAACKKLIRQSLTERQLR